MSSAVNLYRWCRPGGPGPGPGGHWLLDGQLPQLLRPGHGGLHVEPPAEIDPVDRPPRTLSWRLFATGSVLKLQFCVSPFPLIILLTEYYSGAPPDLTEPKTLYDS